jgi:putative PIG3 family NAD(P)H quinone oxidoreductase
MRAVVVGDDHVCRLGEQPLPAPQAGEVRIAVHATAVNRADLLQKAGLYPPPPGASTILGLECAGIVDAVGEGVTAWREGEAVCALLGGGGYAEYACVDARHCLPVPAGLSFEQAAALPEAFATAWLNLWQEAALQPGERVFLPAGASGVGTAAIQLCRVFGNPCFVSVGNRAKLDQCLALGASGGVVRGESAPATLGTMDVILDPVGGSALADHLGLLGSDGRLVLIGLMGGRQGEVDLGRLLVKRLRLIGSTLRSRSAGDKAGLIADLRNRVWPHLAAGRLHPVIDSIRPLADAEAAHTHVAANRNTGKVVLRLR